ncbi:transketolase [Gammaproteobacteria bacterium 45_16_T64]|nr:transketolase [Gammaproteobacteria bacterium 45_16_T64]
MVTLTKKNVKSWSRIGSRATFGSVLYELAESREELVVLSSDTSTSAGLDRFRKKFPEKFVEVGIAEQNLIGIAAGMASEGMDVVTATFSPFQTLRCCEQIKVNLGYMKHKVCFVGLASGVVLGKLGYTHCSIEDMAVMRAIPNITVLSPADCGETAKAVEAALNHDGPVYIRLTGSAPSPVVYEEDYDFTIGKSVNLLNGSEVSIIATGTMVHRALEAGKQLTESGVSTSVINIHTIKPIDQSAVQNACENARLIVTIEEHSVIGGLGSAVAEVKTEQANAPPQIIMGIRDSYQNSGGYQEILEREGLTKESIVKTVEDWWRKNIE